MLLAELPYQWGDWIVSHNAKLNEHQESFLATLAAGVSLQEALNAHRLKWGTIAAWRRWQPAFRRAHNNALKTGCPKRRMLRMVLNFKTRYGDQLTLVPELADLLENARARVIARTSGHADARDPNASAEIETRHTERQPF